MNTTKRNYSLAIIAVIIFIIATIIGNSRGQETYQTTRYQKLLAVSDKAVVRIIYMKKRPDQPFQTFLQIVDGPSQQLYNMSDLYAINNPRKQK